MSQPATSETENFALFFQDFHIFGDEFNLTGSFTFIWIHSETTHKALLIRVFQFNSLH